MSKLEDAKALIAEYKEREWEDRTDEQEAIKKAEADMLRYSDQMHQALAANDYKTYKKTKQAYHDAKEALDFFREKDAAGFLVSESEYTILKDGIHKEMLDFNQECQKKVLDILNSIMELSEEISETLNDANDTLYTLQHDVYKCKDMPAYLASGGASFLKIEDARLKDADFGLLWFLHDVLNKARDYEILPTLRG